ncbi:MAG: LON peptidase substrate-binding domain-containing protein [Candidatus Dormibacteraceae bacterium]
MDELLLPLFPLELVLLPGELLPLHIFEDRYKQMMTDCLVDSPLRVRTQDFGVVLLTGQEMQTVGCSAELIRVAKKYDDGRMDILTRGRRRFEILFTDDGKPYLRGGVQFFDDEAQAPAPAEAEVGKALDLLQEVVKRIPHSYPTSEIPSKPHPQLSFQIGALLPLDMEFKQHILILRSEAERFREITHAMEEMIPALDLAARARHKAGGNGHLRPHE